MRSKNSILSIIFIIVISIVTVFAQTGDIDENQTQPKENAKATKVRENVTLRYEVSPVAMKYLFTSKTEANVKIENLTDATKNKVFVSTLNSTTSLTLTSDEVSVDDFKIKVAIDKISGAYKIDDPFSVDFYKSGRRGPQTIILWPDRRKVLAMHGESAIKDAQVYLNGYEKQK